jgi:hypothetical protein
VKLENTRENYSFHTGKTSDIIRQVGLAGIAVVWVFKAEVGGKQTVPRELLLAALLIVVSLALDLLHYMTGSLVWGIYNRYKENQNTAQDDEFTAPRQINWPTIALFWLKTLVMITAYGFIFHFLYNRVGAS